MNGFEEAESPPRHPKWLSGMLSVRTRNSACSIAGVVAMRESGMPFHDPSIINFVEWLNRLANAKSQQELTALATAAARSILDADGATLTVREGEDCYVAGADGVTMECVGHRLKVSECGCGLVLLTGKPLIVADLHSDNRPHFDWLRDQPQKAFAIIPIGQGPVVGTLAAYWNRVHQVEPCELNVLTALASAACTSMENFRMVTSLREAHRDAEDRAAENAALLTCLRKSMEQEAAALRASEEAERRYQSLANNVPAVLWSADPEGRSTLFSDQLTAWTGMPVADALGDGWSSLVHPDDLPSLRAEKVRHMADRSPWELEFRLRNRGGGFSWVHCSGRARIHDGRFVGYVGSMVDITERRAMEESLRSSEERLRMLMRELDHRVKNNLAAVLSVCDQTCAATVEGGASYELFRQTFRGRIQAMAGAHSLLASSGWRGAMLRQVIDAVVVPMVPGAAEGSRFPVEAMIATGPDLMLPANAAFPMSATLHELSVNAAKYGAWSAGASKGCVELGWSVECDDTLRLEWRERGGPRVSAPVRGGFGSSLVKGMIAYELGGRVDLRFEPEGVICSMAFPLNGRRIVVGA